MPLFMIFLFIKFFISLYLINLVSSQHSANECYEMDGRAKRCMPPFQNAAFNILVNVTNTCGKPPIEFCLQTDAIGPSSTCQICDSSDAKLSHPPSYLTDFNNNENLTWWQSETMLQGNQYPNSVNLTLNLGKSFDITYIRLKFWSPRPESFAFYKRTRPEQPWVPYQYYSGTCRHTYGLEADPKVIKDEKQPICTTEASDISPLTGGNIAFSTLENRPNALNFDSNQALQEWVTATDIMVVLTRLNTFGDELFGDPKVLKTYYYAISDFAVGGRCKCNGHAKECVPSTGEGVPQRLVCRCEHHTTGADCDECLPFYNDRPWQRATIHDANECVACMCNGLSERCYFDEDLFRRTGHGGHCIACQQNTDGPHCGRCKENFYRRSDSVCAPCGCNEIGSLGMQCNSLGKCPCKTGVAGDRCDSCAPNHFGLSEVGCQACGCSPVGSLDQPPRCRADSGQCVCKLNVEGQACDRCKPGYFGLDPGSAPTYGSSLRSDPGSETQVAIEDRFGCVKCYCFGHSSVCSSGSSRYVARAIASDFGAGGSQRWKSVVANPGSAGPSAVREVPYSHNVYDQNLGVISPPETNQPVFFVAPDKYLGDQRFSYNRHLSFKLRVDSVDGVIRPSRADIQLVGRINGPSGPTETVIGLPIFAQNNALPTPTNFQTYHFRIHEAPEYGWTPQLSFYEFLGLLSNLTAIRIRATYSASSGAGFIDDVTLQSAKPGTSGGQQTQWIEFCTCPKGYVGQFCESCAAGYRRETAMGGPTSNCVPCECNGHSETCDPESGHCICTDNTVGGNCQLCAPGYYGNALSLDRPKEACKACPCPGQTECFEDVRSRQVICTKCPEGYTGNLCEMCADGYFGEPPRTPCRPCNCNNNTDPNSIGNCDRVTGRCLRCVYNTGGDYCQTCLAGYYGNALVENKGDQCKACDCYAPGTSDLSSARLGICDTVTGLCPCKERVMGRQCSECQTGFWDIRSGSGCRACSCDPLGSLNTSCHIDNGACHCKFGVTGRSCDSCAPNHYGFGSMEGCKECLCDPFGSLSLQCGSDGRCPCKPGITGNKCDRCEENKYDLKGGCRDCPACYGLVQSRVNEQRQKINDLRVLLKDIGERPPAVTDKDFETSINEVHASLDNLKEEAKMATGGDYGIAEKIRELMERIESAIEVERDIKTNLEQTNASVLIPSLRRLKEEAEPALEDLEEALSRAMAYFADEARPAFKAAERASAEFGSQSFLMSNMSRAARTKIEDLTDQAANIHSLATDAFNVTKRTEELAMRMIKGQSSLYSSIEDLYNRYEESERLYNQTRQLSQSALEHANATYEKVLATYQEAIEIKLPQIDVKDLLQQASEVTEQTNNVFPVIEELLVSNRNLLRDAEERAAVLNQILEEAVREQQETDEMLADVDVSRARALKALENAERTLTEAKDTLKTLQDFDGEIQSNQQTASQAMQEVPKIQALIEETEHKRVETEQKLLSTQSEVEAAREQALEAKEIMETIKDQASLIQKEVDTLVADASKLTLKSNQLKDNITRLESGLSSYETKVAAEAALAMEAVLRAEEAQSKGSHNLHKVTEALDLLADIQDQLENLGIVDKEQLDLLELELQRAEQEVIQADLDSRIAKLLEAEREQAASVEAYRAQVEALRKDVENVRSIKESLPEGCFKVVKLEP